MRHVTLAPKVARLGLAVLGGAALTACLIIERFPALAPDPDASIEAATADDACATSPCSDAGTLADGSPESGAGAFRWVTTFVSDGPDAAPSFGDVHAIDGGGAVVTTSFRGALGLGGLSAGGYDITLAQLDRDGSVTWSRTFGGGGDDLVEALTVDDVGFLWLAGSSTSDPPLFSTTPNPTARALPFVAKLGPTGLLLAAVTFDVSGVSSATCGAIAARAGAVVVGCDVAGTIGMTDTGGQVWLETSQSGSSDALVVALDEASLTSRWHRLLGGPGTERVEDLALASNGEVYAVGTFDSPVLLPTTLARKGTALNAYVTALLPTDGSERWTRTYGQSAANGITRALAVTVDHAPGLIVGGDVRGTLDFGSAGVLTAPTREAYAMLLEPDQGATTAIIGIGSSVSTVRGLAVDTAGGRAFVGEVVAAGQPQVGNVYLPGIGIATGAAGFVVKNTGSAIEWVRTYVSDDAVFARRVSAGEGRELTVMGRWSGTTSFGDGVPRTSGPLGSTFVVRLGP